MEEAAAAHLHSRVEERFHWNSRSMPSIAYTAQRGSPQPTVGPQPILFASSVAEYPDDGALFKTLNFAAFRRAFGAAAKIFVDDLLAKETLMDNFIRGFERGASLDRESALAVVSAYALDALVDRDSLSEFDELVFTRELGNE